MGTRLYGAVEQNSALVDNIRLENLRWKRIGKIVLGTSTFRAHLVATVDAPFDRATLDQTHYELF